MDEVTRACNPLWYAAIRNVEFRFFGKSILFHLATESGGVERFHSLELLDCASYLWLEKDMLTYPEYRFDQYDHYEVTSITFDLVRASSDDRWLKHYQLGFNVAIEIWESALLANAPRLVVDGVEYSLQQHVDERPTHDSGRRMSRPMAGFMDRRGHHGGRGRGVLR